MKKIVSVLLLVCMTVLLATGCGSAVDRQNVDAIKESGELVIFTNAAFPPFEYRSGGQPAGVDIDIAAAIAEELGVELKVQDVKFDTIITSVQSGKGALGIAGMTVTDERKESVDFSITYATSVQYIIVPADSTVEKIEDLAGMKIGVQLGTTGDFIVSDEVNGYEGDNGEHVQGVLEGTGASVIQYNNANLAAAAMKENKCEAVVIDKLPAQIIEANYEGTFKVMELVYADGSSTDEEYAIAIAKGNDTLMEVVNNVLTRLQEEGKIADWIVKHSNASVDVEE